MTTLVKRDKLHPAKRYFLAEGEIVYLADYLLTYPCNAYLHLCYAFMHKRLKSYIIDENENAQKEGKISIYSFPIRHMTHEYICENFSKIVFKKENIDKFKRDIDKFSVLDEGRVMTHDFCCPANVEAVAPQIVAVLRRFASKIETEDFDSQAVREYFYSRNEEGDSRFAAGPHMQGDRQNWKLAYTTLWPAELSFSRGDFPIDFMLEVVLPQFRDSLIRSGVSAPKKIAKLVDERFPGLLTDHKIGELVRPKEAKKIKYASVRQYGRGVRQK